MSVKKLVQTSSKISYNLEEELAEKLSSLGAAAGYDIAIYPSIPNATDSKKWVEVIYWKQV